MKRQLKHHAMHIAMCAPMIVIAGILLATGSGLRTLIPLAACMLMMGVMMSAMGQSGRRGGDPH